MRRLRTRPRLDTLVSQQRTTSALPWGRWIYLGLLAAFALALANYAVGDAVILRAEGLALSDRYAIAATFPSRVRAVKVREGDRVVAGDILVELESADMLKDIADLAARSAELSVREAALRSRTSTIEALLPLAQRNADESRVQVARIDAMSTKGLVSSQRFDQALTSGYGSAEKLAELNGQARTIAGELELVTHSNFRAAEALAQLEAFYDRGAVRAPVAGIVGAKVPVPGQVARFGDELMQINGATSYVLAYMPDAYLFGVTAGDRVRLRAGARTAVGRIDAILGVADALPAEFQNMFRPRDRSRLLRILVEEGERFALSQKVEVGQCWPGWC